MIVVTDAAHKLALESGICVQILREAGHLDTRGFSCCVDLGNIPDGLNATQLERYPGARYRPKVRLNHPQELLPAA